MHGIAGRIAAHAAVSHAQGGIGVGRLRPSVHFAEAAHIDLVEFGHFALIAVERGAINFIDQAVELQPVADDGIFGEGLETVGGHVRVNFGRVAESRLRIERVEIGIHVLAHEVGLHFEAVVLGPIGGKEFHLAQIVVEIGGQCHAIRRLHEIAIEFFLLSAGLDLLFASVESLPVGLHARGEAKNEAPEGDGVGMEVLCAVGEAEEVVVVERVAHGGHERIDALDDVFVFRPATARGKFAESGFLARLDVEQTGGSDAGVHAAEVFHHVAELHVLAGVL